MKPEHAPQSVVIGCAISVITGAILGAVTADGLAASIQWFVGPRLESPITLGGEAIVIGLIVGSIVGLVVKLKQSRTLLRIVVVVEILCLATALILGVSGYLCRRILKTDLDRTDETFAVRFLETLRNDQKRFASVHNGHFGTFDELVAAGFLDNRFVGNSPTVRGYQFTINLQPDNSEGSRYSVQACPIMHQWRSYKQARYFLLDSGSNSIHQSSLRPATVDDPPL